MASVDRIREAKHAAPFRPFSLRLADGTTYHIRHPEYISIPPVARPREFLYYSVVNGDGEHFESHWIDFNLVAEVVIQDAAPAEPAAAG